jgi:hypothetical protein
VEARDWADWLCLPVGVCWFIVGSWSFQISRGSRRNTLTSGLLIRGRCVDLGMIAVGRLGGLHFVEAVDRSGVLLMPFAVLVWLSGGAFCWFSPMAAKKLPNGVPVITLKPPSLCSFPLLER